MILEKDPRWNERKKTSVASSAFGTSLLSDREHLSAELAAKFLDSGETKAWASVVDAMIANSITCFVNDNPNR